MSTEKNAKKTPGDIAGKTLILLMALSLCYIALKPQSKKSSSSTFYSSAGTALKNLPHTHFALLLTLILITLIFLIVTALVRYRPALGAQKNIKLPSMHPAIASYAMRGGFFDPNRIIALTMSRLARKGVLTIELDGDFFLCRRTTKEDSSLTDIDKAVLHFLERMVSYRNTRLEEKLGITLLCSPNIQEFAHTDRKLYTDLIDEIHDAFYRQAKQEEIKENPANIFISATFAWNIGLFVTSATLTLFEIATHNTPVLFSVGLFLLVLSFLSFSFTYLMLKSGVPWSYRTGRQGAQVDKALRSPSGSTILKNKDMQGYLDALALNDAYRGKKTSINASQTSSVIYKTLPIINVGRWIRPSSTFGNLISTAHKNLSDHIIGYLVILIIMAFPAGVIFLALYSLTKGAEIVEGNEALGIIGLFALIVLLIPITSYLLLRITHFAVNLPARLLPSKTKYNRQLPNMHPAIASFLDNGGTLSFKRILSSSLLHLVALDVLGIEKREDAQGKETVVFIQKYDDVDDLHVTGIDKHVLNLVDFVIRDRLRKRTNARAEELGSYGLSSDGARVAFLDDFSVVARKEKKEYKKYVQEINDAIGQELENRELVSINKNCWNYTYLAITYAPLLIVGPLVALFLLPLGIVMRILMALFSLCFGFIAVKRLPNFSDIYLPLSLEGYRATANLRPLKRWLKDFTLLKEKDVLSAKVWKEYIAYASAFGLPAAVYDDLSQLADDKDEILKILAVKLKAT